MTAGGGYQVEHPKLRQAAGELNGHGDGIKQLQQHAQAAQVPAKAWGLLGMSTGLFGIYQLMLGDLEGHLDKMGVEITTLGDTMRDVAKAYEETEKEVEARMRDIMRKLNKASPDPTGPDLRANPGAVPRLDPGTIPEVGMNPEALS